MEEFGEAAKIYVYLKLFETILALFVAPFVIFYLYKFWKRSKLL